MKTTKISPIQNFSNHFYFLIILLTCFASPVFCSENLGTENNSNDSTVEKEDDSGLYQDISLEQSNLAHRALRQAYSANIKYAHKSLNAMRELETAKNLPPLSYLLSIAVEVMRYQNGDFEDEDEEKTLRTTIEDLAQEGQRLCITGKEKNPNHPTYLLIMGGIRGFLATLKIHSKPSQALTDGLQALKFLEKSREQDSRTRDSYMGTGIFNCTAANAPLFVRGTLKMIGRSVSMKVGLDALRISAYQGQYTTVASQLFLIQFLSPYEEELKREKRTIFKSLENNFSKNGYYTFLKEDEALCFYPDSFYTAKNKHAMVSKLNGFTTQDYSSRRYVNLVRYQYSLLEKNPEKKLMPDTTFELHDYEYYPVFIKGLRQKHQMLDTLGEGESPSAFELKNLKLWRDSCVHIISESQMNPTRKRYYEWHVHDAFEWNLITTKS